MRLVLDGETAYEYWMRYNSNIIIYPDSAPAQSLTSFDGLTSREISNAIGRCEGSQGLIHLLVQSADMRRPSKFVICHTLTNQTPLPPRSLYHIGTHLYVVSPELCLVRLANTCTRLEFLHKFNNMLGLFSLDPYERMTLLDREPITSKERVRSYIEQNAGMKGTRTVRLALRSVVERCRSPRESTVNLCLRMSTRLGGQALPPFEANYRIPLTDSARLLTSKTYLEGDVVWPSRKTVLEYNSNEWHTNALQVKTDMEKITALQRMDYAVLPMTTRQFSDYDTFEALIAIVRAQLGLRDRTNDDAKRRRQYVQEDLIEVERKLRRAAPLHDTARWKYLESSLDYAS